jgi:hypothetical protein
MWLITTIIAAIGVTILWYVEPKIYKLDLLSLMLWGASCMILVDHILGYARYVNTSIHYLVNDFNHSKTTTKY